MGTLLIGTFGIGTLQIGTLVLARPETGLEGRKIRMSFTAFCLIAMLGNPNTVVAGSPEGCPPSLPHLLGMEEMNRIPES